MIHRERLTARLDGDFVVFLIGMRINNPLMVHKWLPVARSMPRMLKEHYRQPDRGFIHENIYVNMPLFGLGKVGLIQPAIGGRQSAASRLSMGKIAR
jgi:hypothetical protein